jgi:hypothetical protein
VEGPPPLMFLVFRFCVEDFVGNPWITHESFCVNYV